MAVIKISKDVARNFLVRHQGLMGVQVLSGAEAVGKVFGRRRLLQYDPLNPCGRNLDLVLQARIADYHPDDYNAWVYDERNGVEGFDKVLCILPVEDWGFLRFGGEGMYSLRRDFMAKHRADLDKVLAKVRDDGPVPTNGIDDARRVDIGWYGQSAWGKVALESLWRNGELVVMRLPGGRKVFDLPERVYGDRLPTGKPTVYEHIARRLGSVGMLPLSGAGTGWQTMGLGRQLRPLIKEMVERGELVEVAVDGVKPHFVVRAQDQPELRIVESESRMMFVAPLDNLMWDRQMIEALFGFFYRWEVYIPAEKRQYGYYVLPVLYGDRIVGRVEPVLDKSGTLVIKGWWWEQGVEVTEAMRQARDEAVERFREYVRSERVKWMLGTR